MTVSTGYSRLQIALRWGILLLIAVNWFVSDGMEQAFDAHTNGIAYPFFPEIGRASCRERVLMPV